MRVALALSVSALLACSGELTPPEPVSVSPPAPAPDPSPTVSPPLPALDLSEPRDEACTRAEAMDDPPLLAAVQSSASAPELVRSPLYTVESTTLTDGTRVRVSRGGCNGDEETWHVSPALAGAPIEGARKVLDALVLDGKAHVAACLDEAPEPSATAWGMDGVIQCSATHRDGLLVMSYAFSL